jgi:hypothetical protein
MLVVVEMYAVPIPPLAFRASSGAVVMVQTNLADGALCRTPVSKQARRHGLQRVRRPRTDVIWCVDS